MRRLFTALMLLLSVGYVSSQTPDYFANNPSWHVSIEGGVPGMGTGYYSSSFLLYLNGDTTVQGQTYHKLYTRGYDDNNGTLPPSSAVYFNHLYMLVRQEGKSIRYFEDQQQVDSLLIDYDLTVGDTFKGMVFHNENIVVEDIDSVLIGSEYRKVFKSNIAPGNFNAAIEGVAEASFLDSIFPTGMFGASVFRPYEQLGVEHIPIVCYGQNDAVLWTGSGVECNLTVGVPDVLPEPDLVWYDSENKTIRIESYDGESRLFNSIGQEVVRTTEGFISGDNLDPGIYLVHLEKSGMVSAHRIYIH